MNKKYSINEEGVVSVLTDNGEITREEKFNKNTEEILALENVVESLNNKINWFNKEIMDLENKTKHNLMFMIVQIIISILLVLIINLLVVITLNSLLIIGLIEMFLISTTVMKTIKHKNKIDKYNKKINHINYIINKVNKRINNLSVDKTKSEIEKINEYQDVKIIYNYNFDPNDYFINKYNIDKRTQEFNNSKNKVRRLTKKNNQGLLKYN